MTCSPALTRCSSPWTCGPRFYVGPITVRQPASTARLWIDQSVARWSEIENAEPEFARTVRARLDPTTHKTLATLRADAQDPRHPARRRSPRISGLDCFRSAIFRRRGADPPSGESHRFLCEVADAALIGLNDARDRLVIEIGPSARTPLDRGRVDPEGAGKIEAMAETDGTGTWTIYLSGEIHSDWRERIAEGVRDADLPVELLSPVTDHGASDDVGVDILGPEDEGFWKDHKGAGVNAVRTQTLLRRADVVVVRFGDKYRQWNAAFEAGYAAALGKPLVTLHDEGLTHALKEVDRAAMATAETPEQIVEILRYAIAGPGVRV